MQVEPSNAIASSSPLSSLSSLVPSSVPSIEPKATVAGSRAKVTYSRKPIEAEDDGSSQPTSPSNHVFDSPMRSYGRNANTRTDRNGNGADIVTESSPATTVPAANSAIKIGPSSLFRRVDSQPSQHSDNDDVDDDDTHPRNSTDSPAVNRTKKFNLGMARAIFDSDSDSDVGAKVARSNAASKPLASTSERDDDDDDAIIARIRAQTVRDADSDPFTGSLSSVPPSSSQAQSSLQRSSLDSGDEGMVDDDHDGSITITRRRGTKISAMKAKGGKPRPSKFTSSSDKGASEASDPDDDPVQSRKPRTFKLVSSESSASAMQAGQDDAEAGPSVFNATAPSRREKMDALAARARKAQGETEADTEAHAQADPLLDAFFGGGSPGRIPSRSPSLDIQDSDEDEHNDAMPAFMAPQSKNTATNIKSQKKKQPAKERDILSDLEDDFDRANAKVASKRAGTARDKAQPKVKPLSKKEIEDMHKQTARMARENRTRLAPTHQKKTIGLNDLLSKIRTTEARRGTVAQVTSTNAGADSASDGSAQPSSQIPSGQSKSQHASDPIESDPIPERSSPHPNYSSSPVVPMSRQQERRLGLDQSTSSANFLQNGAAGRVAGLAIKQGQALQSHQHLLMSTDQDDDDDNAQLPDLAAIVKQSRDQQEADKEAARKKQQLRDMKLRLLEKSRRQPPSVDSKEAAVASEAGQKSAQMDLEDEDDLEVYQPGSVLAAKHNILATPGKKRPTDLLYREIGIRPGKTPPSRKSYTGTNANGSPSALVNKSEDAENGDEQDNLIVTDSELRSAGKILFIAADKAAGHVPATQAQAASTPARQDEAHTHFSSTQGAGRTGPPKMTQAQLNATLMRKMQSQSLKARSHTGAKNASARTAAASASDRQARMAAPDVDAMLQRLGEAASGEGQGHGRGQNGEFDDDDEDDPDFIMPAARNAESVIGDPIGSDVDMGSASEIEQADEEQDFIDMGSADEDDENQLVDEAGVRDTIEDADDDSEKENAPPPASQQSQRSHASPALNRSALPSRAVMDDDEDEMPAARLTARRGRRSALADDDEDHDEAEENALQPGPFDSSRGIATMGNAGQTQSQGWPRVPLGDISSQSIDQSMPFSRSNTSSPAIQHAQAPGLVAAARRDPPVVPLSSGQDEDESFRTDDIPSQAADLGRFFEPTMPPPTATKSVFAASQPPKSFWDQTQTQSQTQSQSQLPSSARPSPQATDARRELVRDESANSALGAFFQDTQQDELRGESLDIFENPKNAGGKAHGFTQLFSDGTPQPSADGPGAAGALKAAPSVWDASAMPPPKSTEVDAFAALRKAQMGEAMDLLETTPSVLPSFDESQAEREAYAQAQSNGQMANMSPEKMYMNRDGFFTQTKPSQQVGLWSQYDSQSQSQSQHQAVGGASGAWPSPAARRASDLSNIGDDRLGSIFDDDEDEDAPVQLKRLRRGGAHSAAAEDVVERQDHNNDADSEIDDENGPPSSQPEPKTRNAFDVLRQGHLQAVFDDEPVSKGKKRKSAFIEGEAEESEDEELGGQKRGDGGGLKGVFGDDNDSAAGADEDEDDEDDADAADLQELVDNERELDEAEKDEVARARFRADMDAKDREDLEIHQKAIQGGYRNRRGRAGLNGIEGFLDDDADDEELKRRAALGSHASTSAWKKRKLLDGTEDGMDALAAHEEAQAFVKSYAATHVVDHESDKYDFLAMAAAEQDDEDSEQSEDEDMEADQAAEEEEMVEEDAFGPVVSKKPSTIGYKDVASIVRERRKAKRSALDDDEEEDDTVQARSKGNGWDSDDEDDTEAKLASALHDRIKGVSTTQTGSGQATATAQSLRKPYLGVQYGRTAARTVATSHDSVDAMEVDTQEVVPDVEADEADDDNDVGPGSIMARLLSRHTAPRPSSLLRSGSSLATAVDMLEDAEPEWGNDANIVRAPKPTASGNNSQSSSSAAKTLAFGSKASSDKMRTGRDKGGKIGSMLLSKQAIMRRESGFSSSSSESR